MEQGYRLELERQDEQLGSTYRLRLAGRLQNLSGLAPAPIRRAAMCKSGCNTLSMRTVLPIISAA